MNFTVLGIVLSLAAVAALVFAFTRKQTPLPALSDDEESEVDRQLSPPKTTSPAAEAAAAKPASTKTEAPAARPSPPATTEVPAPSPSGTTAAKSPLPPPSAKSTPKAATPKPSAAALTPPADAARDEQAPSSGEEVEPEPSAKQEPPRALSTAPAPASVRLTRPKDVSAVRKGLSKVRENEGFFGRLKSVFGGAKTLDPHVLEQIEEVLLTSDVGVATTELLVSAIREGLAKAELKDSERVWEALRDEATRILDIGGGALRQSAHPTVVMMVGVNGVGKTTTIGKLASKLSAEGKKVVLAAGDTFRAAAVQQLAVWGKRVGCEVVSGKDGANPGAVIFDAITRAKEIGADFVLADTAGRLHTKSNLMDELAKVARTLSKAMDGAPHETLLVLDATTGQNAVQQAAMFKEALPLSGIVLTKLDGTAKGGVILGICAEHAVPVRYVGIGERADDLRDFDAEEFVEAMLGQSGDSTTAAA